MKTNPFFYNVLILSILNLSICTRKNEFILFRRNYACGIYNNAAI